MHFTPRKIQIVEDEVIVALDLQNRLKKLGFIVTSISGAGEDALLRVRIDQPDLVLMDINLKGAIDGVQTAHRMRAEYEVPVVFLTAYADDKTLERAKITEAYGYLLKPCGDRELRVAIEIGIYKAQADRKLRGLQRWLSSTMKSLGDGVIGTDLNCNVNYMNPLAERLTGWSWSDAQGQGLSVVFNAIDETTRMPIINPAQRALIEGVAVSFPSRTLLIQKDGKEISIDDSCAPNIDEKNVANGTVLVFRDATPLRLAESEAIRTKEIAYRNEKLTTLGRIASGVAHDFNNLMHIVTGYTEMVLSEMPDSMAAQRLRIVIDAAIKASGVAQNLVSYSKQSAALPENYELNEGVKSMHRVLNAVSKEKVQIEYRLHNDDLPIYVDKSQLCQVLLNLAVNACDAMPDGGAITIITLPIDVPPGNFDFGLMKPGPAACMKFIDSGPGIDDATKEHLFEPYFTRKAPGKGTGLGLATVAGILAKCGGHISVQSEIGKGTTFNVYIPLRTVEVKNHI